MCLREGIARLLVSILDGGTCDIRRSIIDGVCVSMQDDKPNQFVSPDC